MSNKLRLNQLPTKPSNTSLSEFSLVSTKEGSDVKIEYLEVKQDIVTHIENNLVVPPPSFPLPTKMFSGVEKYYFQLIPPTDLISNAAGFNEFNLYLPFAMFANTDLIGAALLVSDLNGYVGQVKLNLVDANNNNAIILALTIDANKMYSDNAEWLRTAIDVTDKNIRTSGSATLTASGSPKGLGLWVCLKGYDPTNIPS